MKTHSLFIAVMALLFTLVSSCKKDLMSYENDPRVYFFEQDATVNKAPVYVKSFSFATEQASVAEYTVNIKVKIMGLAATNKRTFTAEAVTKGTNALVGTDYKFLPGTIDANQIEGILPVVLYRTADLKTVTKQLVLKVSDVGDFKGGTVEHNGFTLIWNDNLIKPDNWDTRPGLVTYFGVYSVVKYQFIINTLNRSAFPIQTSTYDPNLLTNAQMLDLKVSLKTALVVYNNTHSTPLTDEFGVAVTFP